MRLICPNCGAQYEVPESVIPENGRDVQCSGCGHTWFQHHPDHAPLVDDATTPDGWDSASDDHSADGSLFADDDPSPDSQRPAAPQTAPDAAPAAPDDEWQGFPQDPGLTAPPAQGRLQPDPEDIIARLPEVEEEDYEEDPANDLPPPRRRLDSSVADLLREEAEREARARAAERASGLEMQPDLGLDEAPARDPAPTRADSTAGPAPAARRPMAETPPVAPRVAAPQPVTPPSPPPAESAGDDRIAALAAAAVADSRRGLLPDIEEINSSLRAASDRRPARADDHELPGQAADPRQIPDQAQRRGFSRGFSVTLLIAMVLLALYVFAPALADAVPALNPILSGYVGAIDALRLSLDAQAQALSRWLAAIAGSTS